MKKRREKAKAIISKLLQLEQFGEEKKSLKAEKKIPKSSETPEFLSFLDEEGFIRAKVKICKNQLNFNPKHPILLHWKHQAVELILQNLHKENQSESAEHVRRDVDPRNTKRPKTNQEEVCYCRKGRAQTITPVMFDLLKEELDASIAFKKR